MDNPIFEILFPRFCLGCGYVGRYICPQCERGMKKLKTSTCFYCDRPTLLGLTHPLCKRKNGIDGHLSIYRYDRFFKKILLESKYKGAHKVLRELISFPHEKAINTINIWKRMFSPRVISVPLHPQRLRERGFNQSEKIARFFFPEEDETNILKRVVNTSHLAGMKNKSERNKCIKNAFQLVGKESPHCALLVDDVVTTGATLSECSKTLKNGGVQVVLAFSLAKG